MKKAIIKGTSLSPRVCVFKSNKHVYIQVIDDTIGHTIASVSTLDKEIRLSGVKANLAGMQVIAELLAKRLNKLKCNKSIFDRNGFRYGGLIKKVCEELRTRNVVH